MRDWLRKPFLWIFGVAILLIAVTYWQAPRGEFVYDDNQQIELNPLIKDPALYSKALTSDVWAFQSASLESTSNYYRPAFTLLNILCYQAFQLNPIGWHWVNIALHTFATLLILLFLLKMACPAPVAAAVTWIFAAHPVHVESVTWIAGSPDLLMTIFLVMAFLAQVSIKSSWLRMGAVSILVFGAMASKEVSIAALPIALALEYWRHSTNALEGSGRLNWKRYGLVALPIGCAIAGYFLLKSNLVEGGLRAQTDVSWMSMALTAPSIFTFYLRQSLLPYELSSMYPLRAVNPDQLTALNFWLPTILFLGVSALLVRVVKGSPVRIFGLVLFIGTLLPAFYIRAFDPESMVRDRYLYFPIMGLFLVITHWLYERFVATKEPKPIKPFVIATGAFALGLGLLAYPYNEAFMSNESLWRKGVSTDPNSVRANRNLADALMLANVTGEAETYALKAIELNPEDGKSYVTAGLVYKKGYNYPKAVEYLITAIKLDPGNATAYENLGEIFVDAGQFDRALAVYAQQRVSIPSAKPTILRNETVTLVRAKRIPEALANLERNIKDMDGTLVPTAYSNWFYLGKLYELTGQPEKARAPLERYIKLASSATDPLNQQHVTTAKQMLQRLP